MTVGGEKELLSAADAGVTERTMSELRIEKTVSVRMNDLLYGYGVARIR